MQHPLLFNPYYNSLLSRHFKFSISVTREFSSATDAKIMQILKLETRLTENFTCMDENNTVDLKSLMNNNNAELILQESGYKP
jgi:hypothetical protein